MPTHPREKILGAPVITHQHKYQPRCTQSQMDTSYLWPPLSDPTHPLLSLLLSLFFFPFCPSSSFSLSLFAQDSLLDAAFFSDHAWSGNTVAGHGRGRGRPRSPTPGQEMASPTPSSSPTTSGRGTPPPSMGEGEADLARPRLVEGRRRRPWAGVRPTSPAHIWPGDGLPDGFFCFDHVWSRDAVAGHGRGRATAGPTTPAHTWSSASQARSGQAGTRPGHGSLGQRSGRREPSGNMEGADWMRKPSGRCGRGGRRRCSAPAASMCPTPAANSRTKRERESRKKKGKKGRKKGTEGEREGGELELTMGATNMRCPSVIGCTWAGIYADV